MANPRLERARANRPALPVPENPELSFRKKDSLEARSCEEAWLQESSGNAVTLDAVRHLPALSA
eukprot:CAMPEP_0174728482 /NCGR_PEP_ID=MMETSP1094-20130205/51810_1 /TAXON_ID=156173 /ORGANISM="Chrysochromulina brevifilum, Strain UTEX LB 985" /LENGTH=63 /DNA_ID=CAMNT_0015930415 /DNA_START=77 /DNA_END=268 /DNA_ORIENTATION=+